MQDVCRHKPFPFTALHALFLFLSLSLWLYQTGENSLNLKYLAIKKTPRNKAKKAVLDLAVFRSKDKPAAIYKKLGA